MFQLVLISAALLIHILQQGPQSEDTIRNAVQSALGFALGFHQSQIIFAFDRWRPFERLAVQVISEVDLRRRFRCNSMHREQSAPYVIFECDACLHVSNLLLLATVGRLRTCAFAIASIEYCAVHPIPKNDSTSNGVSLAIRTVAVFRHRLICVC